MPFWKPILPSCLVQLRAWNDTNGHPVSHAAPDHSYGVMATGYCDCWHGFTFNPGLRRLSDYRRLGASYENQPRTMYVVAKTPTAALPFEVEASAFYHRLGYRAVILTRADMSAISVRTAMSLMRTTAIRV